MQNDPDENLLDACRRGDIDAVNAAIARGATVLNRGLQNACNYNRIDVAKLLIKNGVINLKWGLYGACLGGHRELAELIIELAKNIPNIPNIHDFVRRREFIAFGLYGACRGGHRELVELMLEKDAGCLRKSAIFAGIGGHREIVELMLEKHAGRLRKGAIITDIGKYCGITNITEIMSEYEVDINRILYGACRGGHHELVELLIKRGATRWNLGMLGACEGGHRDLVERMLILGANQISNTTTSKEEGNRFFAFVWGLYGTCRYGHLELAKFLIEYDYNGSCYYQRHDFEYGLTHATSGGHRDLVELMIANGATNFSWGLSTTRNHEMIDLMYKYDAEISLNRVYEIDYSMFYEIDTIEYKTIDLGKWLSDDEYIKSSWKMHNAKAAPIIRMLRRYVKRLRKTKCIQRWWRRTYPLWQELAYAPPNGIRYLQSRKRFIESLKI